MNRNWKAALTLCVVTALAGCASHSGQTSSREDHEEEGDEVKMQFAEAPPAVQDTLRRESHGATIQTVDKETNHGRTIYEADVMVNGENWEIKVGEDGQLLTKKQDRESSEESNEGKHHSG